MFDIKRFCEDKGLNQTEFGKIIDVEQSVVSHMVRGLRKFRLEHIEKLREKYGDIVDNYRTDGRVTPQPPAATMSPAPDTTDTLRDVQGTYDASKNNVAVIEQPPFVPDNVVRRPDVDVMEWVSDPNNDHSQNAFNIASIMRRTKFVIQMNNNAMAPTLYQNEYVFLKPFAEDSEIIDGEIYGIETKSRGILIRFLYNDGDFYLTRPKNTREFGDIRIPRSKDVNLYHIVFHGSTHLSSLPDNEGDMVKQLNQQSEYISSLIGQVGDSMKEVTRAGARTDRVIEQNAELIKRLMKE